MRILRAFLLFLRHAPWQAAPEWTAADSRTLATFLASSTGLKLRRFLQSEIAAANERAAMKASPFECGWACGYRGLYAWFESLSTAGEAPAGAEDEPDFF